MTLDSTTSKVQYTQAGTTTAWPVTFKFLDNEDLIVVTTVDDVDTTLVLDTDYTVTGAGDDDGGTVTISPAVAAGTRVTIYRQVDLDQPTALTVAGGWYPTVHEAVFDRLTMQVQQVQEQADRSLRLGVTSTLDPEAVVEDIFEARDDAQTAAAAAEDSAIRAEIAATTTSYYNHEGTLSAGEDTITLPWAYDTDAGVEVYLSGVKQTESALTFTDVYTVTLDSPVDADTPYEVVSTVGAQSGLDTLLAASGGSALVGFLQDGTGAVARTAQAKMRDFVSVKDFGAVGDGVTDDTAAIQAAADYCRDNRKTLFIPAPDEHYLISDTITIQCQVSGEIPHGASYAGQFIATSEITAFLIKGSRLKISNVGVLFQLTSAATSAVGFKFGDATTQFSNNICENLYVRYAHRSYTCNNSGSGTIWNNTFLHCRSDFQTDWGWYFNAVVGSTTQAWISCMIDGVSTSEGGESTGWYTSNIDDVSWINCQADDILVDDASDAAIYVNLASNVYIRNFRTEAGEITASGGRVIYANGSVDVGGIKVLAWTFDPGSSGRATIIGLGTTGDSIIGPIELESCEIESGAFYRLDANGLQFGVFGRCTIVAPGIYRADVRMDDVGVRTIFANKGFVITPTSQVDPTAGAYEIGDKVSSAIINGSSLPKAERTCITSGSSGTLSGVTGSIASGSNALTINTITGLYEGAYISIAGVSGKKRVVHISGTTTAYLDTAADTTVIDAAVSFYTPVFKLSSTLTLRGLTASRPSLTSTDVGVMYMDTALDADGKPIWWTGTAWVDATGATV